MYTTCIFCHKPLGNNEAIEQFPVGRRLAFDSARGRLWVVCRNCERWNLTPLETRWEAVEECERTFRDTKLRVSTDNIGLARLREGLDLVRIGEPQRPEFAAWRYGDQFGRRRVKAFLIGGGAVVAAGAVVAGVSAAGISIGGFSSIWWQLPRILGRLRAVRLKTDNGRLLKIHGDSLKSVQFFAQSDSPRLSLKHENRLEVFYGDEALRHARKLIPAINATGGTKKTVQVAVQTLERHRGSEAFMKTIMGGYATFPRHELIPVSKRDASTRLAIEMALHEEAERLAIEGELYALEEAWREAEEIASISDNLFVRPQVEKQLSAMKKRGGEEDQ